MPDEFYAFRNDLVMFDGPGVYIHLKRMVQWAPPPGRYAWYKIDTLYMLEFYMSKGLQEIAYLTKDKMEKL